MSIKPVSVAILAVLALSACRKDDANTDAAGASAPTGLLGQATAEAKVAEAKAALPQPDAGKPLASYPELKSGQQIMFFYVAASRLPPDYAKLAASFSQEYRDTGDSFRKNDLMQAIKPQIEVKIAEAKATPYGWMDIDDSDNLGSYDFERKGFPVSEFASGRTRYFGDAYEYKITWINHPQLAFAPVADEAAARQLEAMRANYGDKPRLKIYFFAQSADLNDQLVNALVTRVQITDKFGRVLAEYGPEGSVAVAQESRQDDASGDPAADAAAAAAAM